MAVLDEILSEIGLPSVRVASRRAPRPQFSPEEEASILGTIGQNTLSGLQYVGETLDKPGRAIRGLLAGQPGELANLIPFSDTIGLTDPQQSVSGRGLLEQYGMLGANEDGIDLGDVAGFGAEVLLDPLSYLNPFGALGRAGQVAKKAGLMPDLAKVASKRMGAREARSAKTLGDLLAPRFGEEAATGAAWNIDRAKDAMRAAGPGVDLDELAKQPLGGLVGYGLPFRDPSGVIGTGPTAQRVARLMDTISSTVRHGNIPGTNFSPVSALNRLLNNKAGDALNPVSQDIVMPDIFRGREAARVTARGKYVNLAKQLLRAGGPLAEDTTDGGRLLTRMWEGIDAPPTPEMAQVFQAHREIVDPMVPELKEWGMHAPELYDSKVLYAARYKTKSLADRTGKKQLITVDDPTNVGRDPMLRNLGQGTDTIKQMLLDDPVLGGLLDAKAPVSDVAARIGSQHGLDVPPLFVERTGGNSMMSHIDIKDRREALAKYFLSLDDATRATGIYGNHPVQDLAIRTLSFQESKELGQRAMTALADPELLAVASERSRTPGQFVPLKDVLSQIGFYPGDAKEGALKKWLKLRGLDHTNDAMIDFAGKFQIPKDFADDMVRRIQGFKSPEVASEIIAAVVDPLNNLFKGGVTSPFMAFHVRNRASGAFGNWLADRFSLRSEAEADKLARGQAADLTDIPIVKAELRRLGLPETPENSSEVIRGLGYQHNLTNPNQAVNAPASTASAPVSLGSTLGDLIADQPGRIMAGRGEPYNPLDAWDMLTGKSGTTWNPLKANVRGGFSGATDTTFAPMKAGEHVGEYVEFANRYAGFIHDLRNGYSPAEAAARTMASQVDYSNRNYTNFQKQVLFRMFPFGKYTSGMIPYTISQLWEKPGGKLAQTIRGVNEMRGDESSAPDYVRETAAIGLGQQEDGSQRYITGFGLPFEDPLSFVGGGVQGALLEGASRLNPIVKAPLEWMTGESFFQKGPSGGREIEDLDPTIGRIMSNVAGWGDGQAAAYSEPVKLPAAVEFLVGNSPLSRLLTTIRSATDERKHDPAGLMNLLSGIKVSDISPAAQDTVTRERMQALMKTLGAKSFENVYFPKAQVAEMPPEQQIKVLQLEALKQELVRKAKERKAAKETR